MLKKSTILAAAAFGLVGYGASTVQAAPATDKQWELTLVGSGASDEEFDSNAIGATAQVGYYFTDAMQANLRQSFSTSGGDTTEGTWSASTAVGFDYHFDFGQDQRIIPFVGVAVGYNYGDDTNDTFFAGPEAGVKFYVNDTTFIFGQVAYQFFFEDSDDADDAFEDGSFVYSIGVGFRF